MLHTPLGIIHHQTFINLFYMYPITVISVVFELDYFAGVASCSANGAFFFVLEGLDNALPAEKMAAFC